VSRARWEAAANVPVDAVEAAVGLLDDLQVAREAVGVAMGLLDDWLGLAGARDTWDGGDVVDRLLDVRRLLAIVVDD
jgi:hypothetical protein